MTKHLFYFVAAFAIGCVAALAARSAWFQPYTEHAAHPAAPDYSQMVTNPAAPAEDLHAGHDAAAPGETVNTVCAICGMDVDPSIEPATYQGKPVGFGCRMCPPKFTADPDRYGPAALRNEVVPE